MIGRAVAFRRLYLPYGVWTSECGRDVAFNRHYKPLFSRLVGAPAIRADSAEWVEGIVRTAHLYSGATPEKEKRDAGSRLLREWDLPVPASARQARLFWDART